MPPSVRAFAGRLKSGLPLLPWLLLGFVLTFGCLVVLLLLFLRLLPGWVATSAADESASRAAILVFLGGMVAVVGAVFTARTFLLNRQGQLTDRFSTAIELLGNAGSIDVQMGGIYALERIARESASDRRPIVEILTAFVREHAPRVDRLAPRTTSQGATFQNWMGAPPPAWPPTSPAADVQAALTAITRLPTQEYRDDGAGLDLSGLDLQGARLRAAHLERVNLIDANLANADLSGAHMARAQLVRTVLTGANLSRSDLRGASLQAAQLQGVYAFEADLGSAPMGDKVSITCALFDSDISEAHLQGVNLRGAALQNANFSQSLLLKADLRNATFDTADLTGSSLSGAQLEGADLSATSLETVALSGASFDSETKWPPDFEATHAPEV